jgi:asparagine synthase (glutamine-hydrolysing)
MGSLAVVLSRTRPEPERARAMLAAAPHRGGETEMVECGNGVLGVSNDPAVRDSTVAQSNREAAVFSGALDNEAELRAELERRGPVEPGAAGVVLAATRAWGNAALDRLRGAFGAAVVRDGELVLMRDHVGLSTLFDHADAERVVAATEAKQVVRGAEIDRRADLDALADIFFGRLAERRTALRGVERVPRASRVRASRDLSLTVERYWDPERLLETSSLGVPEAGERMLELLEQAVTRSVTGRDVVSLSGGIDSTTIAALAALEHRARSGRALPALTAVYPEHPSVDEREYVEQVAGALELSLHTYVPTASPLDDLAHWVGVTDGPADTLSIPEVAENYRRARELGARSVLSGELAEYVLTVTSHFAGHLALHGRWGALTRWARALRARGRSRRDVLRRIAPSLTPAFLAGRYTRLRRRENRLLPAWIDPDEVGGLGRRPDLEHRARDRWRHAQVAPLHGAAITLEADALCAASLGVQVRRPFADVDLWEFMLSLRAETKFPDLVAKRLVRDAMRGRLPDAVLDRMDKTAFDEYALAAADYEALRRWTLGGDVRIPGVDYDRLRDRLDRRDLGIVELSWANDLARVHAFAEGCA